MITTARFTPELHIKQKLNHKAQVLTQQTSLGLQSEKSRNAGTQDLDEPSAEHQNQDQKNMS
jgi:hypothetical protein